MKIERKDCEWLEKSLRQLSRKPIEYEGIRGSVDVLSIMRSRRGVKIQILSHDHYAHESGTWVKKEETLIITLDNPTIELVDRKKIHFSIFHVYCIVFLNNDTSLSAKADVPI